MRCGGMLIELCVSKSDDGKINFSGANPEFYSFCFINNFSLHKLFNCLLVPKFQCAL